MEIGRALTLEIGDEKRVVCRHNDFMLTKLLNDAIEFFYRRRWLSILLIILVVAGGIWAHETLDTEAYPEFTAPTVRIITLAPGKGAEEVERLITIPLEKELNGYSKRNLDALNFYSWSFCDQCSF